MALAYSLRVIFKTDHDVSRNDLNILIQDPNKGMKQAAKDGDDDIVQFFIKKGANQWSEQSSNPTSERW